MSSDDSRGCFVWYDLKTTDPEAAQGFYTQLIGWGTEAWSGGGMDYTMWKNGETTIGGIMQLPEEARKAGAPPHWLAYVATPDTDATVERAKALGATVMVPPTDIPNVGRFSVLADPQGAVFSAYSHAGESPASGLPGPGDFSWHELISTDHEAGFAFYSELFGWEKTDAMDMGELGTYQMYGLPGGEMPLGGMYNKTAEMPGPPAWLFYITVADLDAALAKLKELGGQVLNGPEEVPGGVVAQCLDAQGAAFALHQKAAQSEG